MKEDVIPCNKEEMDRLIEASMEDEFFYMLFLTAKTTGRRLGEFYGVEEKIETGRKVVGKKKVYDRDGNVLYIDKTVPILKKTNVWNYGVRVKDIDFNKGTVKIFVLKRKRYKQDETILLPDVVRVIRQYVAKNKLTEEDHLFRKLSYRQIQNKVKYFSKKAGIKHNVSFHNFRHYFISEFSRMGWSHDKIAKLTGHKSIGTLTIYDHVIAEDLREDAMNVLKNL